MMSGIKNHDPTIMTGEIVSLPADEIIADPNHAWHAIRGYDFAGLESMLKSGLLPAQNQQDYSVSLSASPAVSANINKEARSFQTYSLQDGISLAVNTETPTYPSGDHGGFEDEIRASNIDSEQLDAILLSEGTLAMPLVDIRTFIEPRKPAQAMEYIVRTIEHLDELGAELEEKDMQVIDATKSILETNKPLDKDKSREQERIFLKAYSRYLQSSVGIPEPTVADMLRLVLERTQRLGTMKVLEYDESLKEQIQATSEKIAVEKSRQSLVGSFGVAHSA